MFTCLYHGWSWAIRRDAHLLYTLVPNIQMLVQQDHVMLFHYEPISYTETRVRMATLAHSNEPQTVQKQAYWDKNQRITVTAIMEDFVLGEEVQAGFASKGNPSHLFGRFEGALNRFNLVVQELIAT